MLKVFVLGYVAHHQDGWAMWFVWGEQKCVRVWVGKPEGNSCFRDLGIDRREWTGLNWPEIGTSGRLS